MIAQPELAVRDMVQDLLGELHADPAEVHEIFAARPAEERQEIADFLAAQEVPVHLAYPRNAAEFPAVFVDVGSAAEERQFIGGAVGEAETGEVFLEESGSLFRGTVHLTCWAANATLAVYLQTLVQWALQRGRDELQAAHGLDEQQLTVTGFMQLPQGFPDFAFRRDVLLSCLYPATVKVAVPKVAAVTVAASAYNQPGAQVTGGR